MTSGLSVSGAGGGVRRKNHQAAAPRISSRPTTAPGGPAGTAFFLLLGLGGGLILRLGGKVVFLFSGQIIFRRLEEGRVVKVQLHLGLAEAGAQADLYFVLGRGCFEFGFVCHAFTPGRPAHLAVTHGGHACRKGSEKIPAERRCRAYGCGGPCVKTRAANMRACPAGDGGPLKSRGGGMALLFAAIPGAACAREKFCRFSVSWCRR